MNLSLDDLSKDQAEAYDLMCRGKSVFVTGSAGSGKTAVIKLYFALHKDTKNIGLTSTTGTSAILIGGTTLHSFLGIGLATGTVEKLYHDIMHKKPRKIRDRWKTLDVLILDEVSMLSVELFEKLEALARSVKKSTKPFGGIQLIFTGDYFQLPAIGSVSLVFLSPLWAKCVPHVVYMKHIFRQGESSFKKCLNECRTGEVSEESLELLRSRVDANLRTSNGIIPTKIYSLNRDVDAENDENLAGLRRGDALLQYYEYEREVAVLAPKVTNVEDRVKKGCTAPEHLTLCVGAQVMLLYNLCLESGLSNGSRGVVTGFTVSVESNVEVPVVAFVGGQEMPVDYVTWVIEEDGNELISVTQIPLKVAYACSIHKIQGITLDLAEVDLKGVFEYGQAYTALSRVRTIEGLTIKNFKKERIMADPEVVKYYKSLE